MLGNVIFKFIRVWIILIICLKGTVLGIDVRDGDGDVKVVTYAKNKNNFTYLCYCLYNNTER